MNFIKKFTCMFSEDPTLSKRYLSQHPDSRMRKVS